MAFGGPIPFHALIVFSAGAWLYRLGGIGLVLLALADNSVVPLPGSMDALTIFLSAGQRGWWWYYAAMATLGSVIGGYLTYRLARAGGKEMLEKKISRKRAEQVYDRFERWGFGSVAVGALIPPPFPIVPVLLTAGAMQYPRNKFLAALALGRAVRFGLLAFVASIYGRRILSFFSQYYKPALWTLVALAFAGGIVALVLYRRRRRRQGPARRAHHKVA